MTKKSNKKVFKLIIAICLSLLSAYTAIATPQTKIKASIEQQPQLKVISPNTNNIKLEGDVTLTRGNQIISVSLRDSDIKQVLRMFADKAGLNIIFHNSVEGKITLDLVNVTLNDAFKMIIQMGELSYIIDNDTLMVMSAEASKKLNVSKENMSTIPIKYVDAAKIAAFLNTNVFLINKPGLSNDQIVVTNPAKNELLIFGTENDYKMAKKIVDKLDTKPITTTYKVNHTTPKEMASLLCNTLFLAPKDGGSGYTSNVSTDSGSTSASENSITLGDGIVACTISSSPKTDKLTSLPSNNLSIVYKPALGTITMVGGTPEQIAMVNEFISTNDKKQPQAYLEFSIVELSEDGSKEFNNSWQVLSKSFSASFGTDGLVTNPLYPSFWKGSNTDELSKYTGPLTITQNISYLITNGKGRLLANPKVIVTNGKSSTIDLTSDYISSVTTQIIQGNGITSAVQRTYNVSKDNGMKIEITPFISPDGYVSMNLKPEYATIKGEVDDVAADGKTPILAATLLQRRNLNLSNIRVKDGETLAIGGLINEVETQSIKKVPILGDIPGIGMLFRNQKKVKQKSELVIMITPRIIKDTEDVVRI